MTRHQATLRSNYISPLYSPFDDTYSPELLAEVARLEAKGVTIGVWQAENGWYARPFTSERYGIGSMSSKSPEAAAWLVIERLENETWFRWSHER